jgi:hypothetical protein
VRNILPHSWIYSRPRLASFFLFVNAAAVQAMHDSLGVTSGQFSASISLVVLLQGIMPPAWIAVSASEVKGRKVSCTKSKFEFGNNIALCSWCISSRVRATDASIPTAYLALQPYLKTNPDKTRDDYDREVAKMVLDGASTLHPIHGFSYLGSI